MKVVLLGLALLALIVIWIPGPSEPERVVTVSASEVADSVDPGSVADESLRVARWRWAQDYDSYLAAMLPEADSTVRRWPSDQDALRIFLATTRDVDRDAHGAVREALGRWWRVGDFSLPMTYELVADSARADVIVRWVPYLAGRKAGQADISVDSAGWIRQGELTLALGNEQGFRFTRDALYTVALHEIGHLLGLGHSDDPADVMYPETSIHQLTYRDRNTLRLLYAIPAGPIRAAQ